MGWGREIGNNDNDEKKRGDVDGFHVETNGRKIQNGVFIDWDDDGWVGCEGGGIAQSKG